MLLLQIMILRYFACWVSLSPQTMQVVVWHRSVRSVRYLCTNTKSACCLPSRAGPRLDGTTIFTFSFKVSIVCFGDHEYGQKYLLITCSLRVLRLPFYHFQARVVDSLGTGYTGYWTWLTEFSFRPLQILHAYKIYIFRSLHFLLINLIDRDNSTSTSASVKQVLSLSANKYITFHI